MRLDGRQEARGLPQQCGGASPRGLWPGVGGPMRPFHWFKNGCQLVGLSLTPAINKLIWLQGTEAVVHWGWG